MNTRFCRTELLYGPDAMEKLKNAHVAVFGIGGVGGYVVEALARSGIGFLDLIDDDVVCLSNINRQIIATTETLGKPKVAAARDRVLQINPDARVRTFRTFFLPETASQFDFSRYDYVVDAIDTVTGKLLLAETCQKQHIPIISAMGAGNKVDPTAFQVADIYETQVCPLARIMRKELKKRGVTSLKVVYSRELPMEPMGELPTEEGAHAARRQTPGSNAFVPPVVGLIIASEVIKDLTGVKGMGMGL